MSNNIPSDAFILSWHPFQAVVSPSLVFIKYLVMHIVIKTRDLQGNQSLRLLAFYHDALSLMTAKDCIALMKKDTCAQDQDPAHHLFLLGPSRAQPQQGVFEVPTPARW